MAMSRSRVGWGLLVLTLATGCGTAPAVPRGYSQPDRISVAPKTLDVSRGEETTLSFSLDRSLDAAVEIWSERGRRVRVLRAPSGSERRSIRWDGRSERGMPVPAGVYLYRIQAAGAVASGSPVKMRRTEPGEEILAQRFTYDADSRRISFILPEPARVRLRMGVRQLPVMRTYYWWEPLEAGRHEIEWDGLDASGRVTLGRHPKVGLDLVARALPPRSILVRSGPVQTADPCAEVCFELSMPAVSTFEDGTPVVEEGATVRVRIGERDRESLVNARFEVMLFLDTVFLFEEEDGAPVFSYELDTRALSPGRHLLTANVLGYDDRLGSQSLEFIVRERAAPGAD